MTLEEYLGQDKYFSESQQEFVEITSLPWLRAYYSYRKCMESWPEEFPGSVLYKRFEEILSPPPRVLAEALRQFGEASCMYRVFGDGIGVHHDRARNRLFQAAKRIGVKVKTHNAQYDSRGGNFIRAEVVNETSVRLKGQLVA